MSFNSFFSTVGFFGGKMCTLNKLMILDALVNPQMQKNANKIS